MKNIIQDLPTESKLQDMAEFIDPCLERKKAPIKIS